MYLSWPDYYRSISILVILKNITPSDYLHSIIVLKQNLYIFHSFTTPPMFIQIIKFLCSLYNSFKNVCQYFSIYHKYREIHKICKICPTWFFPQTYDILQSMLSIPKKNIFINVFSLYFPCFFIFKKVTWKKTKKVFFILLLY